MTEQNLQQNSLAVSSSSANTIPRVVGIQKVESTPLLSNLDHIPGGSRLSKRLVYNHNSSSSLHQPTKSEGHNTHRSGDGHNTHRSGDGHNTQRTGDGHTGIVEEHPVVTEYLEQIAEVMDSINVDSWKNIPLPICNAFRSSVHGFDATKQFAMYLEHKTHATQQKNDKSAIDLMNFVHQAIKDVLNQANEFQRDFNHQLLNYQDKMEAVISEREKKLTATLTKTTNDQIAQLTTNLKSWATKTIDDKVNMTEKKSEKKFKELKDQFSIPGFIGSFNCIYNSFPDYIQKQVALNENVLTKLNDHFVHTNGNDKKLDVIFEKLSFFQTHFIDIRHELTEKFDSKLLEINTSLNAKSSEHLDQLNSQIKALDYGDIQRTFVNMLVADQWAKSQQILNSVEKQANEHEHELQQSRVHVGAINTQLSVCIRDLVNIRQETQTSFQKQFQEIQKLQDQLRLQQQMISQQSKAYNDQNKVQQEQFAATQRQMQERQNEFQRQQQEKEAIQNEFMRQQQEKQLHQLQSRAHQSIPTQQSEPQQVRDTIRSSHSHLSLPQQKNESQSHASTGVQIKEGLKPPSNQNLTQHKIDSSSGSSQLKNHISKPSSIQSRGHEVVISSQNNQQKPHENEILQVNQTIQSIKVGKLDAISEKRQNIPVNLHQPSVSSYQSSKPATQIQNNQQFTTYALSQKSFSPAQGREINNSFQERQNLQNEQPNMMDIDASIIAPLQQDQVRLRVQQQTETPQSIHKDLSQQREDPYIQEPYVQTDRIQMNSSNLLSQRHKILQHDKLEINRSNAMSIQNASKNQDQFEFSGAAQAPEMKSQFNKIKNQSQNTGLSESQIANQQFQISPAVFEGNENQNKNQFINANEQQKLENLPMLEFEPLPVTLLNSNLVSSKSNVGVVSLPPASSTELPLFLYDEIDHLLSRIKSLEAQVQSLDPNFQQQHSFKQKKKKMKATEYQKVLQQKILQGQDVTLAQALVVTGKQKNNSNSPELTLKSPREGPLRWDAENKRWLNAPKDFNPDFKMTIDATSTVQNRIRDTIQAPMLLKEQLQFLRTSELEQQQQLQAQTKLTQRKQFSHGQDEDADLCIQAKSVKQLPRYDFDKIFGAQQPDQLNHETLPSLYQSRGAANIQRNGRPMTGVRQQGSLFEPVFTVTKHSYEVMLNRGDQTVIKHQQAYKLGNIGQRMVSAREYRGENQALMETQEIDIDE